MRVAIAYSAVGRLEITAIGSLSAYRHGFSAPNRVLLRGCANISPVPPD